MKALSLIFISFLTTSAFSFADTTYVLCRSDKTVRTVRIENGTSEGMCITKYTKSGVDQTVASSKSNKSCMTVLENIRTNLEKASWNCKDISSSKISKEDLSSQ